LIVVKGVVLQLDLSGSLPRLRYRTRNLQALFAEVEWDWSPRKSDRHIFPTFEEAAAHVRDLTSLGIEHVHAAVYGPDADEAQKEAARAPRAPEAAETLTPGERKEIVRKTRRIFSRSDAEARWQQEHDL